jgi:hypothetical protein
MRSVYTPKCFLLSCIFFFGALPLFAKDSTLIKFGSTWDYLDNGTDQGTAWRSATTVTGWSTGIASFGYGDEQRTTISYGANPNAKYITTYFRYTLNIVNIASYDSFRIRMYADDGAIVYVNGTQRAITSNVAGGAAYNVTATAASADNGHAVLTTYNVPKAGFISGDNIIAVEVHQNVATTPDMMFDLELTGITGATEPMLSRGPLVQVSSETAMTIRWTTGTATTSRVKYGTSENSLTTTVSDNTSVTEHVIRITGLTADTKYYYAVGSATSIVRGSYRNYFVTAPTASTTRKIRIGVFGDPGKGDANQKGSRDAYIRLKNNYAASEVAIMLGDNAYNSGTQGEHQTGFFDIYSNNILDNHILLPVPGNHEYANDASTPTSSNLRYTRNIPYYSVFTLPTAAESGGVASGTEQYYSVDYGNIHFIMLDTYGYTPDPLDPTNFTKHTRIFDDTLNGPQAKWLKQDLAANANTHKWTIVCMHHPPYTNGTHQTNNTGGEADLLLVRQRLTPIFERFGVDLVIAGHSHVYERSFLVKDHTGTLSTPFNTAAAGAGTKISSSSGRYDGSVASGVATTDTSVATSSCPYFTIDSVYKHGTIYVVAGSAGQIGSGTGATYPVFYTRNQAASAGGEVGSMMLEIQDNRLDGKFVGNSGTIRDRFTIMKGTNKKTVVNSLVNAPVNMTASWVGGYNWYTVPATTTATSRIMAVAPPTAGTYTYYVSDSLTPQVTCITDTFTLMVTSPLAVSVIKFDAFLKGSKVLVQWTTAQEVNSDYFTVERSTNGLDYEMIMVIDGKGNSNTPTNYEFIDNNPLEGVSYYRLVATDKDGDKKTVGVRTVNNRVNRSFSLSVKPNPAVNNAINATIQSARQQTLKIKLFDMRGSEVYNNSLYATAGNNIIKIPAVPGTYVLSIEATDGAKVNERVIVK